MNLVGKIFVVLIFVLSLVLMSLTVTVYMTHTNWRRYATNPDVSNGYPLGLKEQRDALLAENDKLQTLSAELTDIIERERTAQRSALTALQNEYNEKKEALDKLEEEVTDLRAQTSRATTAVKTAQEEANILARDNAKIREDIARAMVARDAEIKKNVQLTDQLNELNREIAALKKRSEAMSQELGSAMQAMSYLDIKPDVNYYSSMTAPEGLVGRVNVVSANGMIEVSVGSDSGVRVGHQFQVVSGDDSKYLGKVQVVSVEPDRAVCKNIPGFENGVYTPGCRVKPAPVSVGRVTVGGN